MPKTLRFKMSRRSGIDHGVSLADRRRWYSDDGDGEDPKPNDAPPAPRGDDLESMTREELETDLLRTRSEAKGRRLTVRELEQQLADTEGRLTSAEQTRRAELERRGEYETISQQQAQELDDLRIKAAELERLRARQVVQNKEDLAKLPEHMQVLFPEWGSPDDQSEWLKKASPLLTAAPPPKMDGGAGGMGRSPGGSTTKLTAEEKTMAAKAGMTEEQYAAHK